MKQHPNCCSSGNRWKKIRSDRFYGFAMSLQCKSNTFQLIGGECSASRIAFSSYLTVILSLISDFFRRSSLTSRQVQSGS